MRKKSSTPPLLSIKSVASHLLYRNGYSVLTRTFRLRLMCSYAVEGPTGPTYYSCYYDETTGQRTSPVASSVCPSQVSSTERTARSLAAVFRCARREKGLGTAGAQLVRQSCTTWKVAKSNSDRGRRWCRKTSDVGHNPPPDVPCFSFASTFHAADTCHSSWLTDAIQADSGGCGPRPSYGFKRSLHDARRLSPPPSTPEHDAIQQRQYKPKAAKAKRDSFRQQARGEALDDEDVVAAEGVKKTAAQKYGRVAA